MMKKKLKNSCFTLVEMLTVVAIILILVSLMFPAMNKLKAQAGRLNCLNRIKDIALMNLRFAARNNGEICFVIYGANSKAVDRSKDGGPPGIKLPDNSYENWQRLMANDEAGYKVPNESTEWWKFICDNALPGWNGWGMKTGNGGGVDNNNNYWRVKKGSESRARGWPIVWQNVHYYGNFNVYQFNTKREYSYAYWDKELKKIAYGKRNLRLLSDIARPHSRVYTTEHGEDMADWNMMSLLQLKPYTKQINGWRVGLTGGEHPSYIPGYGGGGVGKESIENVGYGTYVQQHKDFALIKRDVEEGRHEGYTLHGFFDGHAEIISAETVGKSQCSASEKAETVKGLYAYPNSLED